MQSAISVPTVFLHATGALRWEFQVLTKIKPQVFVLTSDEEIENKTKQYEAVQTADGKILY